MTARSASNCGWHTSAPECSSKTWQRPVSVMLGCSPSSAARNCRWTAGWSRLPIPRCISCAGLEPCAQRARAGGEVDRFREPRPQDECRGAPGDLSAAELILEAPNLVGLVSDLICVRSRAQMKRVIAASFGAQDGLVDQQRVAGQLSVSAYRRGGRVVGDALPVQGDDA